MANRKITYEVGFTGDTSQLQAALKQAVASLKELGTNPQNLQKGLEGAAHAALELTNHLRNAYNADTGKLDLTRFRQELDKSGKSLEDYAKELRTLGPAGEQAFMQVATAIGAAELPLKRSNQLLNQLWVTMKNTARWRLTTGVLNSFIGGLQQAFGYAKSLDASLNDIRIVTNKSADEMARFAKEANQAAKELSTTTTTYTDASLIYYQQGLDDKAVKERTDATIKMANVTGQSAETISSQMTAVWNNFREGSRTLESYADTMVALGASTASSSKEIAEGLEKFAPIADSVGLSFDYASAALATLVATTRESASVAGNALKTLFSRLEGLKLGETLEDGTDLNKYSQALYTVGINIKDANGELKDMDVILTELGNRWKDLARDEQMALAQTVGGVRQYAQLVALMDNWQVFQQNLTTARTAEGSLEKQAQIYAKSWEAARDRVKAATEDVYNSLINPKVFIDLDKMAQAVLKPLASVLDAVGGLTGLLPIVAALMTKVYSSQIAGVIRDMAINIGLMTGKEQERVRILQSTAAKLTEGLYSTYDDKSSASAKLSILRDYVSLQGELNVKAGQYNEFQMEQIKNGLAIVEVYKSQALASQDILEKTQGVFDKAQDKFDSFIKESAQLGKINIRFGSESQYQQIINDLTLIKTKYVDLTNSIRTGDTKQFLNIINDSIGQIAERSVKLETLKNILGETDQETASWKNNVIDLANELGLLGDGIRLDEEALEAFRNNPEIFEELRKKVSDSGEASVEVYQNFQALFNLLKLGTGNAEGLQTVFYGLINRTKELAEKGYDAEASLKAVTEVIERLRNYKPQQEPIDLANSFVAIANGASRAAMAVRSVTNIIETFSDTTLSASEKLTRSLTSLAMILPVITNTIRGIAAGGATAIGGWVTIAVTVIVGIVKAIDAFNNRQKNAQEKIKKSLDSLNEAKQELESLQSELKTTQDRIKELQDLAASGSISIVEQEELKKLQVQNDLLEQQVELKQALADIALKEAVDTITKNKDTAYTLTTENTDWAKTVDAALGKHESLYKQLSGDEGWNNVLSVIKNRPDFTLEDIINQIGVWYPQQSFQAQNIRQAYENGAKAIYSEVEEVRKEAHTQWIAQNKETYEQLESDYATYLEGYKKGYVTESQLDSLRIKLVQQRKALLGEEKYNEFFIDKVLTALSNFDFHELAIGNSKQLSEAGKELVNQYGISIQDLADRASKEYEKAWNIINELGIKDFYLNFEKLSYLEYSVIANFKVSKDSNVDKVQQFINYLQANAGTPFSVVFDVKTITDEQSEALVTLASGEMIDDELISKLKEVYSGIQDIADFSAWSIEEQIKFLEDNVNQARENVLKQINELEKKKNELEEQIIKNQGEQENKSLTENEKSKLEFEIIWDKAYLTEIEKQLEQLRSYAEEPWEINIEFSDITAAKINNLKKALSLIKEDLTVNADNIVELAKRYPEALIDATYDANQNIIKLNQEKYDQLKQQLDTNNEDSLEAERDKNATLLTMQATTSSALLEIIKAEEGEERSEAITTLGEKIDNNEIEKQDVIKTTAAILSKQLKKEINIRRANQETILEQGAMSKALADTQGENIEATVTNVQSAAKSIWSIIDNLYTNISKGLIDATSGKYTSTDLGEIIPFTFEPGSAGYASYTEALADLKNTPEYIEFNNNQEKLLEIARLLDEAAKNEENDIKWDEILDIFGSLGENIDPEIESIKEAIVNLKEYDSGNLTSSAFIGKFTDYARENDDVQGDIQEILNKSIEALARLLESPDSSKDKSSGSGKSDLIKLDKADLEAEAKTLAEIEDRYHEITREIERQGRVLDALDHQIERTYGLDRLDLYKKKVEELTKKQEDQRIKATRAERYLNEVDRDRLVNAFSATGFDIKPYINEKTGELKDFETIEAHIQQSAQSVVDSYTTFMEEYNKWAEEYEQMDDDAKKDEQIQREAENWKTRYEAEKKTYDDALKTQQEQLDAIKQYEDTLGVINTLAHDIEETARQIEDAKLNEITYRMDVILDVKEARKMIRDFTREIAESFGDALTHGLQVAELDDAQAKDEMAMYKEYMQEYQELQGMLAEATDATDKTAIMAELKELEGNIIASGEALLDWIEKVENMFTEALNAASERFSELTSQLEHNDAILATIKELYALQGQTYKTAEGYARLQAVSQQRLDAQIAQSQLQRKWYENADAMLQQAQAELDALIAEYGSELDAEQDVRYDALKKNRDALLQEQQEAQKQMLSYAQAALETLRQMQLDEIQRTVYEMDQKLSGGVGLDFLQEKYDHFMEEQERYLDPVEEGFETTKWYSKLQADIDKTSNNLHKEKLKSLQQEIDLRRENNTLTKYDLELLEAKYKVLQATMDLEDAQNNKTQLRLVRDSRGNWNYQYTADESDIQAKEQALLQAKQEEYEITKRRNQDLYAELFKMASDYTKEYQQILEDQARGILSTEEAEAKLEELQRYYEERSKYLQTELGIAETDLGSAALTGAILAAGLSESVYETSSDEIKAIVDAFKKTHVPHLLEEATTALGGPGGLQETLATYLGDFEGTSTKIKQAIAGIITTETLDGEGTGFEGLLAKLKEENSDLAERLQSFVETFQGKFGDEGIKGIIGELTGGFTTSMEEMGGSLKEKFVSVIEEYVPIAKRLFEEYGAKIEEVTGKCGIKLGELDSILGDVRESTQKLAEVGPDAVEALWQQTQKAWDAQKAYLAAASAVKEYIDKLLELAKLTGESIAEESKVSTFDEDEDESKRSRSKFKFRSTEGAESIVKPLPLDRSEKAEEEEEETRGKPITEGESVTKGKSDWPPPKGSIVTVKGVAPNRTYEVEGKVYQYGTEEGRYLQDILNQRLNEKGGVNYIDDYLTFALKSGGYTGEWGPEGKFALLHEKELVLNAQDTEKILAAVNAVRDLSDGVFSNIAAQLDKDGFAAMALLGARMGGFGSIEPTSADFNQTVTIESVSFPGVTSSREIEEAFENLVNDAAQWARRRKG